MSAQISPFKHLSVMPDYVVQCRLFCAPMTSRDVNASFINVKAIYSACSQCVYISLSVYLSVSLSLFSVSLCVGL